MKTMTNPEMNVIRFNEADVIVASGDDPMRSFTVTNVCNGISGDATINYCNKEYKADKPFDADVLENTLEANGLRPYCYNSSNVLIPVPALLRNDEAAAFSGFDGKWVYDNGIGAFVKQ